ncbi:hypothetical protein ANCDUO_23375 [Ancylostoma duodenale]|uniref:Uncharacterized protein n=1 Tax=Ancylostoma duodenale TaxID=51022 RepID=A0A0C2FNY1_9BILA|nr:hypothetical protein ANCDUO_23375 [Ancylostoma duodenale]
MPIDDTAEAKKIQEYNRAVARYAEEKELRERRDEFRRAQDTNRKAQEEAAKGENVVSGVEGSIETVRSNPPHTNEGCSTEFHPLTVEETLSLVPS